MLSPSSRFPPGAESHDSTVVISMIRGSNWFMDLLRTVRRLDLPDWYIAGGAVRNLVWDHLTGRRGELGDSDVDVIYFDPHDLSPARDALVGEALRGLHPDIPWEPVNQAAVHRWYPAAYGAEVPPLGSSEDGMRTWPETATAVGVRLFGDDTLRIAAPFGLTDLLGLRLRPNLLRASIGTFEERVRSKGWLRRWPELTVEGDPLPPHSYD